MNKKLGIFGDSSAVPNKKFNHSWVELLSADIEFDNYSAEGASIVYVYDQLLRHSKKYQKLIIFAPPIGRLWMPNFKLQNHFVNHLSAKMLIESASLWDKKILNSVQDYFIDIWHYRRETLIQRGIVDSIRQMFPKALLIPVTPDSIYDNQNCMHYISLLDYEKYNINEYVYDSGRTCHMNKENNKIFYEKIKLWNLSGTFDIDVKDFKYPVETKQELFYDEIN